MNIVPFDFNGNTFRVVQEDEEELLFVAKDVCDVLGYTNPSETLKILDEDELTSEILRSGGQNREMKMVTEPGLWKLIFRSNKPIAKELTRWVTHEVLPTIRKTGVYTIDKELQKEFERQYDERIKKLEAMYEQDRKEAKLEMREDMRRIRFFLDLYTKKVSVYSPQRQNIDTLYAAYKVFCETHKERVGLKTEFEEILERMPGKKYIYNDKALGRVIAGRAFQAEAFEYYYGEENKKRREDLVKKYSVIK